MKTTLYDRHVALGAKIVEFGGWDMPLQYSGIIPEHHAVRNHAGLFDVSHMGRIVVEGLGAEAFLDSLSTNLIAGKPPGTATYTVWCHAEGGCVDDVIVYKDDETHFFVIVNASNRDKDLAHMIKHSPSFDVIITDRFTEEGILALQGPEAKAILSLLIPGVEGLAPMHFVHARYAGQDVIVATTGYTGAGGYEIYAPNDVIGPLWDDLLNVGKSYGLLPVGLGARDTLRLEMGFALYGHELTDAIQPIESVSAWTVRGKTHDFLGKEHQKKGMRSQHGVVLLDKGIAREGYQVFNEGRLIGNVTSGTFSPTLQKAIAIVMSDEPLSEGQTVEIQIRQNRCPAKVVKLPFLVSLSQGSL